MALNRSYLAAFNMHRAALQDLYAQLPAEQSDFRAWPEGMSFTGLADHLAGSSERIMALVQGQAPAAPGSTPPSASLSEARERLEHSTRTLSEFLDSLSDEDISRVVTAFGGRQMPVSTLLDFNINHEAHHKGQAWMMARMIGVQPPFFTKLS